MWNNQRSNQGNRIKLVVFYTPDQPKKSDTFYAFAGEEKTDKAIPNMRKRILQNKVSGLYKTAIFYKDGTEVERWRDGIKVS